MMSIMISREVFPVLSVENSTVASQSGATSCWKSPRNGESAPANAARNRGPTASHHSLSAQRDEPLENPSVGIWQHQGSVASAWIDAGLSDLASGDNATCTG